MNNTAKKTFICYLCFVIDDFMVNCTYHQEMNSSGLKIETEEE